MSSSVRGDVHRPGSRIPSDHARHDRLLVARFAADDAHPTERDEAIALVDRCAACAALAADIRLLRSALIDLPAPRRPRDFRLTEAKAEELKGTGLTRLLRRIAGPGLGPLRPVAGVALSLGIALAVVGTTLPAPVAVDPTDENAVLRTMESLEAPAPGGAPAAPGEGAAEQPEVAPETDPQTDAEAPAQEAPGVTEQYAADAATAPESAFTRDLLIYAGLVIAVISFALLALVTIARRRWQDPLVR